MSDETYEVVDCACGQDHPVMPMVYVDRTLPPIEGVCRLHKTHVPCKRCSESELRDYWRYNGI